MPSLLKNGWSARLLCITIALSVVYDDVPCCGRMNDSEPFGDRAGPRRWLYINVASSQCHPLRCYAIRSLGTAADRPRDIIGREYRYASAQEAELRILARKTIDTREETLDLITSMSCGAREAELRPRIAQHLSGRVRPPSASM